MRSSLASTLRKDLRLLSASEIWFHGKFKVVYLGLARLDRSIAFLRFFWLKNGGTTSACCHLHASHRKQKNHIFSLKVGDALVSKPDDLSRAAYDHLTNILGTVDMRDFAINLAKIHPGAFDLSTLGTPFSEDEIWAAVKSLPTGKAPGPDGFLAEFFRSCWTMIGYTL